MNPIRVMLVDDSIMFTGALRMNIEKQPDMVVAGTASNGEEALDMVERLNPNVILCDIQMPKMTGIEFLQALMPKNPTPVVVISSTPGATLTALQSGAVDFIQKPGPGQTTESFFKKVITTVRTASQANLGAKLASNRVLAAAHKVLEPIKFKGNIQDNIIIAIGASTGGTDAILEVVRDLPKNCPGIVIAQHMPAVFTTMYASRLNKECNMKVSEAANGQRLCQGEIILAAGEMQMRLGKDANGYYVSSRREGKINGHAPSVNVLFESVAQTAGRNSMGVLLTGMGKDGASGLLTMRKAGAYTIGQDQATSVVYGMPAAAVGINAVIKQLPLNKITDEILNRLGS